MNFIELAYKAGLNDFFRPGEKYGHKAYPPPWMDSEEKNAYFEGKKYGKYLTQMEDR